MNHDHCNRDNEPKGFWGTRYSIGLIVLGGVAGYFLLTEHRAHFFGALPYLLLLACPLMHVFMHGGHGHHAHHGDAGGNRSDTSPADQAKPGDRS